MPHLALDHFSWRVLTNAAKHEGISKGLNAIKSDEKHYQENKTAGISTTTDRVAHLAQRVAAGKSVNFDDTTEEGKAMHQAVNNTIALHDKDGYGWNQSARTSVNAYAKAGASSPIPGIDIGGGINGEAGISADNTSNQSLEKDSTIIRDNSTNHNLNTLMRAASNEHYTKDDSVDQSLARSTKASYDKMQSYGESIAQRREEVENYNLSLQASENKGASDRRDVYHDLEQNVMKRYGVSQEAAHQMIERDDKRANKVWDEMVQREVESELAEVKRGRQSVEDKASDASDAFAKERSWKVTDQGQLDLQSKAVIEGLDMNVMQNKINQTQGTLEDKQQKINENANNQIKSIKHHNEVMEQGMNTRNKEYEKDRIGQGKTSKLVGALAQVPTIGHAGDLNVGGPNSEKKLQEYLKGTDTAPQIPNIKNLKNNGDR